MELVDNYKMSIIKPAKNDDGFEDLEIPDDEGGINTIVS